MRAAYDVERLKLRRSRTMLVTTGVLLVVPPALSVAFVAAAGRGGQDALSVKATALVTEPGWAGYLGALTQILATGGLLGVGIVGAWCFGREFADRTLVSLFAAPTSRGELATAKLVLLTAWGLALALALGPVALAVGLVAGYGAPTADDRAALVRLVVMVALTVLLTPAVGLIASLGRGYLPAFGGLLGLVVAAQVAVVVGIGDWFPWSAPGLWAATTPGSGLTPVPAWHLLLVPLTALLLGVLTVRWWDRLELR